MGRGLLTDQGYSVFALAKFCDDRVEGKMLWVGWWLERGTDDGCRPLAAHRENEQAALSAARTSWSYVVRVTHILRRRGLSPGNSCPYRVPPVLVPVCVCVRARPALKLEQLECMVTACTSTRAGELKLKKVQD